MQLNSTDARVQQMFSLLLDSSAKDSDRQKVTLVSKAEAFNSCTSFTNVLYCVWAVGKR